MDAARGRTSRIYIQRAVIQAVIQEKLDVSRDTSTSPCPAPLVSLYSVYSRYSDTADTVIQPIHYTSRYSIPLHETSTCKGQVSQHTVGVRMGGCVCVCMGCVRGLTVESRLTVHELV